MNFTKTILALTFSGLLFTGCKDTGSAPKTEASEAIASANKTPINPEKLETASFTIDGMTCAVGCAKTIEKELSALEGVQKANVDFDNKKATVEFDASKQTPEALVKIVEATADGKTYKVSDVTASKNHAMRFQSDQEDEKKVADKKKAKDEKKAKPGCCSAKKQQCSTDEKKA